MENRNERVMKETVLIQTNSPITRINIVKGLSQVLRLMLITKLKNT